MNRKIVSTDAVATEIVAALGVSERLVAVSHDSDVPAAVADRPRSTRLADRGDGLVVCDDAAFRAVSPDLVVARVGASAIPIADLKSNLSALGLAAAQVVEIRGETLDGMLRDVEHVGEALELGLVGLSIAGGLRARIEAVRESVRNAPLRRMACVGAWASKPWLGDLVTAAGGQLVSLSDASPSIDVAVICALDSDAAPAWPDLLAQRVVIADGGRFMRPGPRLAEAVEILAAMLHPQVVPWLLARWSDVLRPAP